MLSDQEIEAAKAQILRSSTRHHEHNDCIRLAYEWLDAQKTVKATRKRGLDLKHIIERWAGRYVSQSDVEVASVLHKHISGIYPNFNLSARLVKPNERRLAGISEAHTQQYFEKENSVTYASVEP
jgi:hypothetical protein